jgi:hypothetical protein
MATRFNAQPRTNYGVEPLPTGYSQGLTSEFTIPPVGLEDVDVGIFKLFDKEICLSVGGTDGSDLQKVPVVFAGGEKWALLKRNRPMRDKNGTLILPLLTIGRSGFSQDSHEDITGRGINQMVGEIAIRRRLDKSDRGYQNLINRYFLKHQSALAVPSENADLGQLSTIRAVGDLAESGSGLDGAIMTPNRTNNVYETIVVPTPQFVTLRYEIEFWTQFTHHMNQIMEELLSSFLPQTQGWRIDTSKGYWFVGTLDSTTFEPETNFNDMSQTERVIKYKFTVKVPAYIYASSAPGIPIPVKRYVSSPIIKFDVGMPMDMNTSQNVSDDPLLGADDPTLPLAISRVKNIDQRQNGRGRLYTSGQNIDSNDPALQSVPRGRKLPTYKKVTARDSKGNVIKKLVRVAAANPSTGETAFTNAGDLDGLSIIVIED